MERIPSTMKIGEMTSAEFKRKVRPSSVVILPIGAIEEHGPHLPLCTDCIQPVTVAQLAAERTGAFVAPLLPYGVCTSTRDFPGTITISFDALRMVVRDILSEFVRNGFRNIVVLTGHAGREHVAALRVAAKEIVDRHLVKIAVLSDYDIIYDLALVPPEDGHAGTGETSRILQERPQLVKGFPAEQMNRSPKYAVLADSKAYWRGFTGDPSKATKKLGKSLDETVVRELVKIIRDMKKWRVKG